jgi:putative transposase
MRHADYRRPPVAGACWFFTVNLLDRTSRLLTEHIGVLRNSLRHTRQRRPFHIDGRASRPHPRRLDAAGG